MFSLPNVDKIVFFSAKSRVTCFSCMSLIGWKTPALTEIFILKPKQHAGFHFINA